MKRAPRIDGFAVEIFPRVSLGHTSWTARLIDQPFARAEAGTYEGALSALTAAWSEIKKAYRESGIPAPVPQRRRGNKRILDAIRLMGERKGSVIY